MSYVSGFRMTIPKPVKGEIKREELIQNVLDSKMKCTYIQGGAGYGKTTLLSQLANSVPKSIWLSLAGENDVFTFVSTLCEAIKHTFPDYNFNSSEYITMSGNDNFITILTDALISSIEMFSGEIMIALDDLHSIKDIQIRELIACFIKYAPENIRFCLSSRESPWQELIPIYVRGLMLTINQEKLVFTEKETAQILGYSNMNIYKVTEGWPLAVNAFRVLKEDGVSYTDTPSDGKKALYSYLFYECINRLPVDISDFLKASSCFEELDAQMIDDVLNRNNTVYILDSLLLKNIFTIKISNGHYRYHALFRECLLETIDDAVKYLLQYKAAQYYWIRKKYSKAAEYAILLEDKNLLQKIILACYKDFMKSGNFSELRLWFNKLGDDFDISDPEILVAKAAFLSSIGNFTDAKACLDTVIPLLNEDNNNDLYIEAMVHKARVFRNCISFEESNLLLDKLSGQINDPASETGYSVIIEKLYNYCWNSQINEAENLIRQSIEACSRAGNMKIKAWYERYLSAVYFFAGNMKESILYYEKSLEIPQNERQYLDIHGIGVYAAKAYQMMGYRERSLALLTDELQKIRNTGKYEEIWSAYLFAAEIYYQNAFIDIMNGKPGSYETTKKYFELADEYAPLYRKTEFQLQWTKMQRLTYSLIFTNEPKKAIIDEINANMDKASDYLKCILYARLLGFYAAVSDYPNAVKCAICCIRVGEKAGMMLHPALAYGILARASIVTGDSISAEKYIKRYLKLCYELGIYEYFHMRKFYDPILQFAFSHGIEPETGNFFAGFAGYKIKKAYVKTLGGFNILPYNREAPLKMRTRKERELFAYILDAGEQGVTKDQIYNAIWSESDSENIKKVIGVNLTQIKKDLLRLGIENAVICKEKHYSIRKDEIECDSELFEEAALRFEKNPNREEALKLISIYTGEYLADFEALWAISKRLQYHNIYEKAIKLCVSEKQ